MSKVECEEISKSASLKSYNDCPECPEPIGPIGVSSSIDDAATLNAELSEDSPYEVDVTAILDTISFPAVTDSTRISNEKFLCVYEKLTTSNSFKNLFTGVFGGSQDVLNVEFRVTKDLMGKDHLGNDVKANGKTSPLEGSIRDSSTGEVLKLNLLIEIDESYLNNESNFRTVKTVLHESIHAFLILKLLNCNPSYPYDYYEGFDLSEMLFIFYNTLCSGSTNQHDFMFDYMIPTFQDVFTEIGESNLTSQGSINYVENYNLKDLNPLEGISLTEDNIFDWQDFYKYISLEGLHNSNAFINKIKNNQKRNSLYNAYRHLGEEFSKDCQQ